MASIDSFPINSGGDQGVWNEAYERVRNFLETFALGDHTQAPRLALKLVDRAKEIHRDDPSRHPTTLTMEQAHHLMAEWLAANLETSDRPASQIFASGYMALLLGQSLRITPDAFMVTPLSPPVRQALRESLLVTGPDLEISSMTPRSFDYGPMLDLARQTWHKWDAKAIAVAIAFWIGVYFIFYWWLSDFL